MKAWADLWELRNAANGSWATIDPNDSLKDAAGLEAVFHFLEHWQNPEAILRREAVFYGRRDRRVAGYDAGDLDIVADMIHLKTGEGWSMDEAKRHAEFAAWLADEATPSQLRIFSDYKSGTIDFSPPDEMAVVVLLIFLRRTVWGGTLPTQAELRDEYFKSQNRKTVISPKERTAWKSVVRELGLSGLREK